MIIIQHINLDKTATLQTITLKGVLAVLGVYVPSEDNPQAVVIINTSEDTVRKVDLVLLREGEDASAVLYNPKYRGCDKGYYLFEKGIRPKPK